MQKEIRSASKPSRAIKSKAKPALAYAERTPTAPAAAPVKENKQ
jgi:hypothetical protein